MLPPTGVASPFRSASPCASKGGVSRFIFLIVRGGPTIAATAWDSLLTLSSDLSYAQSNGDLPLMVASLGQALILALPVAGAGFLLYSLGSQAARVAWNWSKVTRTRRVVGAVGGVTALAAVGVL
jgi:hypothetical protein